MLRIRLETNHEGKGIGYRIDEGVTDRHFITWQELCETIAGAREIIRQRGFAPEIVASVPVWQNVP
jgi:hypothetical protein